MKAAEPLRTLQGNARAMELDKNGGRELWSDESVKMRANVGGVKGIFATVMMETALSVGAVLSQVNKQHFKQQRPFQVDTTLAPLGGIPSDPSYPSGHATAAAAAATVLANFDKAHASEYEQLAQKVAQARVYSEVHLPSDVAAGSTLGTRIGNWFS